MTDRTTVGRYGVSVDVRADGTLEAVRIDETVTPYGAELGALITRLAREALEEARANVRECLAELSADPRVVAAMDTIEVATDRPYVPPTQPKQVDGPREDEPSEEELIELNERRNRSFFQ